MTNSPAPGAPQTAAKAHVAGLVAAIATFIAPYVATRATEYLDPAWVAKCIDAPSLSMLATGGTALLAGAAAWAGTYLKRNKPV